jgi:hypothetical protein
MLSQQLESLCLVPSQQLELSHNLTLSEFAFGYGPSWAIEASAAVTLSPDLIHSVSLRSALFRHSGSFHQSLRLGFSLSLSCSNYVSASDIRGSFALLPSSNFQPSAFAATPEHSHSTVRGDSVAIAETSNIKLSVFAASSVEISSHFHPSLRLRPSFGTTQLHSSENVGRSYEIRFVIGATTDDDSQSDPSTGVAPYLIAIFVAVALLLCGVAALLLWRFRATTESVKYSVDEEGSGKDEEMSTVIECIPITWENPNTTDGNGTEVMDIFEDEMTEIVPEP